MRSQCERWCVIMIVLHDHDLSALRYSGSRASTQSLGLLDIQDGMLAGFYSCSFFPAEVTSMLSRTSSFDALRQDE
jgi:hypothetical protein